MPNPCLTTAPTLDDPLIIKAKPGQIKFQVTGTVFFDPAQTDVVTSTGKKVPFTCTAQTLSFTAAAGTSYFLEILHGGTLDNSTGELQEDCDAGVTLATLSAANTYALQGCRLKGG
ncbi:hypothetical protein [Tunturiibacter gelidoferens]|uniref:Uncharacterized protein n=1 Tax=Tunturiibacter gelidiferens TaxID=3069689 RepID=A0ACC5P3P8_9BACT|nr:hypothetical protein [Edaphobacter lichenicola]MBB5341462.1 hypothetical protein [Edaphobacter lichenicola]